MKTTTLVIGALLLGGGVYLYTQHQKTAQSAPSLEARVNSALLTETNPFVLTALAQECEKLGRADLAAELNAKAKVLFATTHVASAPGPTLTGDTHPATAILNVASGSTATDTPQLSLAQATIASTPSKTFIPTSPMW
jgi:hypothetical protein